MAGAVVEIAVRPVDQFFDVTLGGVRYKMKLQWSAAPTGGWVLDIYTDQESPILCGIPLVSGVDLLEQYRYLNIGNGGWLYCVTYGDHDAAPTQTNLGTDAHLFWQPYYE
jgi:hypothetical protein